VGKQGAVGEESFSRQRSRHRRQHRAEGVPELLGQAKRRNSLRSTQKKNQTQNNPAAAAKSHFRWIFRTESLNLSAERRDRREGVRNGSGGDERRPSQHPGTIRPAQGPSPPGLSTERHAALRQPQLLLLTDKSKTRIGQSPASTQPRPSEQEALSAPSPSSASNQGQKQTQVPGLEPATPVPAQEVAGKRQRPQASSHRRVHCGAAGAGATTRWRCGKRRYRSRPASLVVSDVQLQLFQSLLEEEGRLADEVYALAQGQGEAVGVEVEGEEASLALLQLQPLQGDFRKLLQQGQKTSVP